jgi:two-component system sensor histidine kinase PilS (NtrC family)
MSSLVIHPSFPSATFWRSLQTLNVSRVVVALVLQVYLSLRSSKDFLFSEQFWFRETAIIYLILAIGFVLIKAYYRKRFMLQLMSQITMDIAIVSLMYLAAGGGRSGLAILYLFPLAGVGILAPLLLAFFFASAVTLFLLLENVYHALQLEDGAPITQAGLYGATYFSVVYVLNRLAKNLVRQEELANRRGRELAVQQAINRLVIADMDDGILVVDQDNRLFEINPAAERMLGFGLSSKMKESKLEDIPALRSIAEAVANEHPSLSNVNTAMRFLSEDAIFVSIRHSDEGSAELATENSLKRAERADFFTHLKLRFVTIDNDDLVELANDKAGYTIIFMQNVSDIENQAQQLKLASMGRLTASIAHEVRNPLSSISYAASLLNEDISNEVQTKRLLSIVDDNVNRLNQLIEDILKLSRKAQADIMPFSLLPEIKLIVSDFLETRSVNGSLIEIDDAIDFKVAFDPGHLREVIVNLLSNALRYASGAPGSIRISPRINTMQRQELHIQDDGPGIEPAVRAHLFEPFYTTSSKGTGLGLYMARELCLNNNALLDYEYRNDELPKTGAQLRGRFVINFSQPDRP